MTKEDILIAEYAGEKFNARKGNSSHLDKFTTYAACLKFIKDNNLEGYEPSISLTGKCDYSTSLDALLPAIEKIESYIYNDENAVYTTWVHIIGKGCFIDFKNETIAMFPSESDQNFTKTEATYKAVASFIEWFNNRELRLNNPVRIIKNLENRDWYTGEPLKIKKELKLDYFLLINEQGIEYYAGLDEIEVIKD